MAQVKIYGHKEQLNGIKPKLSDTIHACLVDVLCLPEQKRFHRFFPLEAEDFIYPGDRSVAYTIIEIDLMAGRTIATRKRLVRALFDRIQRVLPITAQDLEITLIESPPCNWGFRGLHGDEVKLDYPIAVAVYDY
jgi:5-carboxymethyl-2-hydroxymuconate isomerase